MTFHTSSACSGTSIFGPVSNGSGIPEVNNLDFSSSDASQLWFLFLRALTDWLVAVQFSHALPRTCLPHFGWLYKLLLTLLDRISIFWWKETYFRPYNPDLWTEIKTHTLIYDNPCLPRKKIQVQQQTAQPHLMMGLLHTLLDRIHGSTSELEPSTCNGLQRLKGKLKILRKVFTFSSLVHIWFTVWASQAKESHKWAFIQLLQQLTAKGVGLASSP